MGIMKNFMFHTAILVVIIYSLPINADSNTQTSPLDIKTFTDAVNDYKSTDTKRYTTPPPSASLTTAANIQSFLPAEYLSDSFADILSGKSPKIYTDKPTAIDDNPYHAFLKTLGFFCDSGKPDDCNLFGPNSILNLDPPGKGKEETTTALIKSIVNPLDDLKLPPAASSLPDASKTKIAKDMAIVPNLAIAANAIKSIANNRQPLNIPTSDGKTVPLSSAQIAALLGARYKSTQWQQTIKDASAEALLREQVLISAHRAYVEAEMYRMHEQLLLVQSAALATLLRLQKQSDNQASQQEAASAQAEKTRLQYK